MYQPACLCPNSCENNVARQMKMTDKEIRYSRLIPRLARDFVDPSCQEIQNHRPDPVASWEAIPPKRQKIQIDQAEWIHATDNLKHKFSVIIDEGSHLKVTKMLFHMKNTDMHSFLFEHTRNERSRQWTGPS